VSARSVIVTAFAPFDGTGLNSSEAALRHLLREQSPPGLVSAILPVEFGADTALVAPLLREHPRAAVLHLGQAPIAEVHVEHLAVNLRRAPGEARHSRIADDGPPALFSTAPVAEIVAAINAAGIPARESAHAGTYLCNHVFYQSLHQVAREGPRRAVAFLHLPLLPEQAARRGDGARGLDAEAAARAVGVAADLLRRAQAVAPELGL
jgi:pyroglutamyl-peptidase